MSLPTTADSLDRPEGVVDPDDTRLIALRCTGLLDSPPEERFDRLTRMGKRLLRADTTLVSLVDEDRQFFKSASGLPEPWKTERETPLSHSICQYAVQERDVIVIVDAANDERFRDHLAVTEMEIGAYLGAPLIDSRGNAMGAFCVTTRGPREWTEDDVGTVQDLAGIVVDEIEIINARQESDDLLRVLAHDLRNPLTGIRFSAKLLTELKGELSAPHEELISTIYEGADRALNFVSQFLQQRTALSDATKPGGTSVLSEAAERVVELHRASAAAKGIDLRLELGETGPGVVRVKADAAAVDQVVENLVSNGLKFCSPGHTVTVSVAEAEGFGVLTVADDGPGIDPADQKRLFQRFGRLGNEPTGGESSTGLGLAICHRLVNAMGGSIVCRSEAGEGSAFEVRLPLA